MTYKVFWNDLQHDLVFKKYSSNNRTCMILLDDEGIQNITVTKNMPEHLDEDEVAIKDYSENEGILDALIASDIVKPPHRNLYSGMMQIPVCRLIVKP